MPALPRLAPALVATGVALVATWIFVARPVQAVPLLAAPVNEVSASSNGGVNFVFSDPCGIPLTNGQSAACASGDGVSAFYSAGEAGAVGGTVRAGASAMASSVDTTAHHASASAYGRVVDSFAIRGPANGSGQLTGSFVLDGGLDVAVDGAPQSSTVGLASYSFQGSFTGAAAANRSGQLLLATSGADQRTNTSGTAFPMTSTFQFDGDGWAVFLVSMILSVAVEGGGGPYLECSSCVLVPGSFTAVAEFGHTAYWGGIDSITVGGVALTDYEYLASTSGVDYRHSTLLVPEPSTAWLVGLGLIGLYRIGRRGAR